jgi:pimeloyl-ACP methyl ester carboxylesterase
LDGEIEEVKMIWKSIFTGLLLSLITLSCQGRQEDWRVSGVFSDEGGEMEKEGVRVVIQQGALKESVEIVLEKGRKPTHPLPEGYSLVGDVMEIHPRGIVFGKPLEFTFSYNAKDVKEDFISIFYHNGKGWVRMGDSKLDTTTKTITLPLYHSVELAILSRNRKYGIYEKGWNMDTTPLVLIHGALPTSWEGLKKYLKKNKYPNPVWDFEYGVDQGIRESAKLLSDELAKRHEEYGDFKINIVGYDTGGLVGLFYALKDDLYHGDIKNTLITIGTPHKGTSLALHATLLELMIKAEEQGEKPSTEDVDILFSLADALGSRGEELEETSELLDELQELYGNYRKKSADYSNIEDPMFRIECFSGDRVYPFSMDLISLLTDPPSEIISGEGDTYVSVKNTKLSPIENTPFHENHFELLQDDRVFEDILGYLEIEPFSWPKLFQDFSSIDGRRKIVETWEKEFKLNQNDSRSFDLILDFGRNILNSCGQEAILFTNGDNDTYPLWWVQEKEGTRKDVAVANLSLLNTAVFTKYLKAEPHQIPFSFTDEEIDSMKPFTKGGKTVYVSEQIVDDLIKTNQWERPIYYAVTCYRQYMREPRRLEGLVYRFLEEGEGVEVDFEACKKNAHEVYSYEGLFNEKGEVVEGLDPDMENLLQRNYASVYFQLSMEMKEKGDIEGAVRELQQFTRFNPKSSRFRMVVAAQYEEMGRLNEAEAELKKAIELNKEYFPAYKALISIYKKAGRETEGVRLLANWLERHPGDSEAIEFLREYTDKPVE